MQVVDIVKSKESGRAYKVIKHREGYEGFNCRLLNDESKREYYFFDDEVDVIATAQLSQGISDADRQVEKRLIVCECEENAAYITGYVTSGEVTYKKISYIKPIKRDYSDKNHAQCEKYVCPICDLLKNEHQVSKGDTNCTSCGINLLWDEL